MAMAAGKQAPASVLALAALAHASSGEQLARLGPGCASPMAVATAMAAITSHP
jgi:hypothetical protein